MKYHPYFLGNNVKSIEKKLKIAIVAIVILYIIVLGHLVFTIKLQGTVKILCN